MGDASLSTYDSNLNPPSTYPELPSPIASAPCTHDLQPYFNTSRTGGLNGIVIPAAIDTSQWVYTGHFNVSYVRPSLTIVPYAIANNLPYYLVSDFYIGDPDQAQLASDFFFTGGTFSNQTILLAWESSQIKPLINPLLNSYGGDDLPLLPTAWPSKDYDTIWTVTLDAMGKPSFEMGLSLEIHM